MTTSLPAETPPMVAVTGIGVVCPAGVGVVEALRRLAAGPLTPTPPPEPTHPDRVAPWVLTIPEPFDPRRYLRRKKDLKLMARANQLAVAAASLAIEDARLADADATDFGLFVAVGREPGSLDDIVPALARSHRDGRVDLDRLVDEGMGWMNPLSSLKTLPNMSLAHAAIRLGAMGPAETFCAGPGAGPLALRAACAALLRGEAPVVLAGAADARVDFSDRVAATRLAASPEAAAAPVGEAAAFLVLEPLDAARARGARIWGTLEIDPEVPEGADAPPPHALDDGAPLPNDLGDCGAANWLLALALGLAGGAAVGSAGAALRPAETAHAPARFATRRARAHTDPVVISGVGLVTPLGEHLTEFAERLMAGESAVGPIRAFAAEGFPVRNACECAERDPLHRLPDSLADALRGLGDRRGELALLAGLAAAADRGGLPNDAGLVFATGLSSVTCDELEQDCLPFVTNDARFDYAAFAQAPPARRPQAPLRHLVDRPLALLAEHLGLRGPRACHFSACAAATAAIAHAAAWVRRGEAPAVLVGAADSMVHPFGMLPFIRLGATSPESDPALAGRPFDADRDGFVMGEGAAFFVIEPLSRARDAGRHVWATVVGAGSSCDASNVTAPHPDGAGAERAMRAALRSAGLSPSDLGYINAHGTGTPLNDVIEGAAISRVFGEGAVPVSSSKAQIGHAIAAAGAVELLVCLASFSTGRLPPNAHLRTPDPRLTLDLVGDTGRPAHPRFIMSNSFGFGGQNACLVLGHPDGSGASDRAGVA